MQGNRFKKENIFTIPYLMSLIRLLLAPLILWLYCAQKAYALTILVAAVSAITDIIDGKIARKFNIVSDAGKVLDPIADKLTQAALVVCLLSRYPWMWALLILFLIKESLMLFWGYLELKYTASVNSAKWYGKLNTVSLYAVTMILILFADIPETTAKILITICATVMLMALIMYGRLYHAAFRQVPSDSDLKKQLSRGRRAALVLIWAGIIVLCIVYRKELSAEGIAHFTPHNPWLAAIFMLFLFALKSLSIVIYCGLLYAANGILFPLPIAIIMNIIGSLIMVTLPYEIGKKTGSAAVEQIRQKYPRAGSIQELRAKNDFIFTFFARMVRLPSDVLSLYMGAVSVEYPKFLAGSLLGMLPHMITFPIMGMSAKNVRSPEFIISLGAEIAYILITTVIYTLYRKRKKPA